MFSFKTIVNSPIKTLPFWCMTKPRYLSVNHILYRRVINSDLIEQYEEQLAYNSVIESAKLKLGYKTNNIVMLKRKRYEEKLDLAIKTTQPLPLTLKYYKEYDAPKEKNEPEIEQDISEQNFSHFPFKDNDFVDHSPVITKEISSCSAKDEVLARKQLLEEDMKNWMHNYDNYEFDLVDQTEINSVEANWKINYGTPDPKSRISQHPCGGCGALLHCKDTTIPGYIPSEIFKNSFNPNGASLKSILCQRCYFLKEYDVALQVRVSPDEYPRLLQNISLRSSLAVVMVDLTDFPCSIWPGIADIIGPHTPIVVVGNKVDLLPKDQKGFLHRIKQVLTDNMKLCGFASANIKDVQLISAKTGYGVESLINCLQRASQLRGNVYLIGCTNVGKSSLFNAFLQSDYCKIQAADLIQRATISRWPGTTLNLLKFPITRMSGYRLYLRNERLKKVKQVESKEKQLHKDVEEEDVPKYATLMGYISRSLTKNKAKDDTGDAFSVAGNANMSGRTTLGINENHPDYISSRWCFDTPGVVHPDQIVHLLTTNELVQTLPKALIRPQTFCIKPGTTVFIAGLARLDFISGSKSVRVTVFRAKDLPLTLCKTEKATAMYEQLLGTDLFGIPIDEGDRLKHWPGLSLAKKFTVAGKSYKDSSYDVVLSSAGWIAINCGPNEYSFEAWTPEKRGVYVRDCILPKAVTLRGARVRNSMAYKKHKFTL